MITSRPARAEHTTYVISRRGDRRRGRLWPLPAMTTCAQPLRALRRPVAATEATLQLRPAHYEGARQHLIRPIPATIAARTLAPRAETALVDSSSHHDPHHVGGDPTPFDESDHRVSLVEAGVRLQGTDAASSGSTGDHVHTAGPTTPPGAAPVDTFASRMMSPPPRCPWRHGVSSRASPTLRPTEVRVTRPQRSHRP